MEQKMQNSSSKEKLDKKIFQHKEKSLSLQQERENFIFKKAF